MTPHPVVRPRFVVLETGQTLQRLLIRYLDNAEIISVTNLQEAVHQLSLVPAQAVLINDVSASEPLRHLNGSAVLPSGIPIIICSVPEIHEVAGTLGASDYLVKPISRNTLLAALGRLQQEVKTVLIVDDEPEALRLFRRMLASARRGYRILRATNGRQARDILSEQCPDVILLDLVMPNMDGFELLAEKNRDPALRDIPVIVTSARDPMGQPIVSKALTVTQEGGLSLPKLLACIQAISEILSTTGQAGDLVLST